jgi:hypothetical protein
LSPLVGEYGHSSLAWETGPPYSSLKREMIN